MRWHEIFETSQETIDLFHGTTDENASILIRNGWKPNSGNIGANMGQKRYLYVTNEEDNARWFANEKGANTVLMIKNVPISWLIPDPEDGIGETAEEELEYAKKNGFPANFAIKRAIPSNMFSYVNDLKEAPIDNFSLHGFDDPNYDNDSFSAMDKKTLVNPKAQAKLIKRFENIPYHFYMYFLNLKDTPFIDKEEDDFNSNFGKSEQGIFTPKEIKQKYGIIVNLPKDGYGVVYLSNANPSFDRIPVTSWILAHRFSHGLYSSLGIKKLSNTYVATKRLGLDIEKLLTMKSARDKNLDAIEAPIEMLTQFIMTGKISYTTERLTPEQKNDHKLNQEIKRLFDLWNHEASEAMKSARGKLIVTS